MPRRKYDKKTERKISEMNDLVDALGNATLTCPKCKKEVAILWRNKPKGKISEFVCEDCGGNPSY